MLKIQNEEYRKLLLEKDDEINNYKFAIKVKDNQIHELIDKLQQKENKEKEIREYINDNVMVYAFNDKKFPHWDFNDDNIKDILEILDKEVN